MRHKLSNVDLEQMTATCIVCGPNTPVRLNSRKTPVCLVQARLYDRGRHYKKKYGADVAPADKCEVCGSTKKVCYDHDHATGKHRGWLCDRCNRALGIVQDDPALLRALADYLSK
jgi:hypothetical protein